MPIATLPSGLVVGHREWEFNDMGRWAKKAESGGSDDDLLIEATTTTLERVIDPGPYGFLKEGATAIDVDRLLKTDIVWWLYRARAASHPENPELGLTGEDYIFDWQCSKDKKHVVAPKRVRLCDLPMKPLPEASVEHLQTGKPFAVKLPNGDTVWFVLPTFGIDKPMRELMAKRTKELRRTKKGAKAVEPEQNEVVACQITGVSALGENQSFERRAEYIGKLKIRDWAALEKAIKEVAPTINRKADCFCDECGWKTVVPLPLTPGFFLPNLEEGEAEMVAAQENADVETDELEKAGTASSTSTTAP